MQEYLAPYGEESPEFLGELERTVALLAFDRPGESPFADLFSPSHRNATASELNAALLASQCQEKEPRLPRLLKVRTPTRLAGLEPPDSPSSAHEPGEPPPPFARTSAPRQSRGAGRRPSSVWFCPLVHSLTGSRGPPGGGRTPLMRVGRNRGLMCRGVEDSLG